MLISSEMHQCLQILMILIMSWICIYHDDCCIFQITQGVTYQNYSPFSHDWWLIPTQLVPVFGVCVCVCVHAHVLLLMQLVVRCSRAVTSCLCFLSLFVQKCPCLLAVTAIDKRHCQTAWLHRSSLKLSHVSSFQHCVGVLTWEATNTHFWETVYYYWPATECLGVKSS